MKRVNQPKQNRRETRTPRDPLIPVSKAAQTRRRIEILEELFPRGVSRTKIWNALAPILRRESRDHSGDVLEAVAKCKLGIKERVKKYYPNVVDQWYIITWGDTGLLRRVTDRMWSFAHSHVQHSQDVIVLHGGVEPDEFLLDWAAQAVVPMMLEYIGKSV